MKRAQPGWLVLALAAIAAAIGSFFPFYTFSANLELTVWSRSLFPTATLIPVLLVSIGLEALFVLVVGHEPRSPFLNFTWSQARLAGSFFAIVLALSFLVQGRAGADLGSGYLIMSLSALAAFAGAVMTRRAELARGREEIVRGEHPWRAAALRWRRELTARVEAYAAGAKEPRVQPAPVSPDGEKEEDEKPAEKPVEMPEKPAPAPTPVPRLSAVRSEPEADTTSKPPAPTRPPSKRPSKKKAAAKKTVPTAVEPTLVEVEPEEAKHAAPKTEKRRISERKTDEQKTDEQKTEAPEAGPAEARTAEQPAAGAPEARPADAPTAEEPTIEVPKATDVETADQTAELESTEPDTAEQKTADITADVSPAEDGEAETSSDTRADDEAERERPAAPG
jgi:hypothetical protein